MFQARRGVITGFGKTFTFTASPTDSQYRRETSSIKPVSADMDVNKILFGNSVRLYHLYSLNEYISLPKQKGNNYANTLADKRI